MDFLNQLDSDSKDDNSIFTFNDKNENNKGASLPFPFSSQSSAGGAGENIMFLNDMKSQGGESFNLGQFDNENQNNNNFGGLDFLNTICEVPESSNNFFNTQSENNFLSVNINPNQAGLDFINEDKENEEINNFDLSKFQSKNKDEPINIDINNLFKSSKTKKNNDSKTSNFELNNLLNIGNNDKDKDDKLNKNVDNKINPNKNNKLQNNNSVIPNININPIPNSNNEIKEQININNDIKNIPTNKNNNNNISSIQNNNINNNILNKQIPNSFNPNINIIPNKEKISSYNINPSSLSGPSGPSSNPIINPINFNIKDNKDNKDNNPSFPNIQIKPTSINKQQNINLDDIDQIISLNTKIDNKSNNSNISSTKNNILTLNQNFFQGKQDNNANNVNNNTNNIKVDITKDNLKFISNEISNLFNSSLINGKRAELEPKDKDLQNIDNLLNFTKENITSVSKTKKDQSISKDKNNKNININRQKNSNTQLFINNTQKSNPPILNQLPSDSFDKKSQLIKINKNDNIYLSQAETITKNIPSYNAEKAQNLPSKLEMIQIYNDIASRLNKIREKAKEYRNLGNYFSQLIIANENYNVVYPIVLKKLLEEYNEKTNKLLALMKLKNNKMTEMNNEFYEEVKKYSLAFPQKI